MLKISNEISCKLDIWPGSPTQGLPLKVLNHSLPFEATQHLTNLSVSIDSGSTIYNSTMWSFIHFTFENNPHYYVPAYYVLAYYVVCVVHSMN